MGRDRALDRSLTYEALATLIIMMTAARSTAVELVPEALLRCLNACKTCQELNPEYDAHFPFYGRIEDYQTVVSLCAACQPIYKGLESYVREVRALSHVDRVSDEAVTAASNAFGTQDAAGDDARMRRAVEAAVRVLKVEPASPSQTLGQP